MHTTTMNVGPLTACSHFMLNSFTVFSTFLAMMPASALLFPAAPSSLENKSSSKHQDSGETSDVHGNGEHVYLLMMRTFPGTVLMEKLLVSLGLEESK